MKKLVHRLIAVLLALALLLALASCSNKTDNEGNGAATVAEGGKPTKAPKKGSGATLSIRQPEVFTFQASAGFFYVDTSGVAHVKGGAIRTEVTISNAKNLFVNSFVGVGEVYTYYVLREDNSLWGIGANLSGQLGDGTGVDRFDQFVKIADDVVNVFTLGTATRRHTCILKSDGTLWGVGDIGRRGEKPIYAPEQLASDVVDCGYIYYGALEPSLLVLSSNGELKIVNPHKPATDASENILASDVQFISGNSYISNGKLFEITSGSVRPAEYGAIIPAKIAGSITSFSHEYAELRCGSYVIQTQDGQLWGAGINNYGELGNGTKVPLNDFTKLFDNVVSFPLIAYSYEHYYLDNEGNLYYWSQDNPTPSVVMTSVSAIFQINNGNDRNARYCLVLTTDGVLRMLDRGEAGDPNNINTVEISNVKLP